MYKKADNNDCKFLVINASQRPQNNILGILKENNNFQPRIIHPAKLYFKNPGEIDFFRNPRAERLYEYQTHPTINVKENIPGKRQMKSD